MSSINWFCSKIRLSSTPANQISQGLTRSQAPLGNAPFEAPLREKAASGGSAAFAALTTADPFNLATCQQVSQHDPEMFCNINWTGQLDTDN
ncbi:MAG TPA: hypothetical protein VGM05_09675 [Planctomycetaceae bacterium]